MVKGILFISFGLPLKQLSQRSLDGGLRLVAKPLLLQVTKKPNKFANRSKISSDIDRLFPDQKNLVLEMGNFAWSKTELDVARSKGIKIHPPCPKQKKLKYGFEQETLSKP